MLPKTPYGSLLLLVLTSFAFTLNTAWAEKSVVNYSKQETLQCVLNNGFTFDNCTEAVRVRYYDVEIPQLLCGSLHFFNLIYKEIGCQHEDILKLVGIFCHRNLTCTPTITTNQTAITTDPLKETEYSSTVKPTPITESFPDKPKDLTDNAACVTEKMLSNDMCKRLLKLRKNKTLASVCNLLKSDRFRIYNCSETDKDKLRKVVCDKMEVTCPPEPEVSDPGQAVNDLIKDFSESCKEAVQLMLEDFQKNKEETCATIDEDLSEFCSGEEIPKLKHVVCNDKKKP